MFSISYFITKKLQTESDCEFLTRNFMAIFCWNNVTGLHCLMVFTPRNDGYGFMILFNILISYLKIKITKNVTSGLRVDLKS